MSTPERPAGIRVVGFDLDQTLYPKSPEVDRKIQEYILERVAKDCSVSLGEADKLFSERYQGGRGMTGTETLLDLGLPDAQAIVQEALERADIAATLTPDPETLRLIRDLHSTYGSVDLVTGSDSMQTAKKLAALGFAAADFDHLITADDASKATGESYKKWLALYPTLSPEQFMYIGDRPRSDHEVPAALGIRTALVYVTAPDPGIPCIQLPSFAALRPLLLP